MAQMAHFSFQQEFLIPNSEFRGKTKLCFYFMY